MRNKEFQKLLKKQKFQSNSGFTLTELLVGLFMSIFVIGAMGFGLMQVLRSTQTEGARVEARNEASRALEFITDEIRRARMIEDDAANANGFSVANSKVVLALDIAEISGNSDPDGDGDLFGVDNNITTSERIVYYLKNENDTNIDPWEGPQVLYRWGPPLDANGNYTDGNWNSEALIDKIDDTTVTSGICGTGQTLTPATSASGFYACINDDDNDGNTENLTDTNGDGTISTADGYTVSSNDTNGDSVIDDEDSADVDGTGIAAQIYFTGGTATATESGSGYSADTQVVARARVAPDNSSEDLSSYTMSFRSLNPSFACNTNPTDNWEMRTDFGESLSNPSNLTQWNHIQNRQPQPIKITGDTLVISSIPRNTSGTCLNSRANNGREADRTPPRDFSGNKTLGASEDWTTNDDVVAISHAINFKDPRTFNGDPDPCPSYPCATSADGKVYSQKDGAAAALNPAVKVLKHGSVVPDFGGYDPEGDGTDANNDGNVDDGNQQSLGEFLASRNPPLAVADGTFANGATKYVVTDKLQPDERIIAFEIGKDTISSSDPGVDFQDNIFVVSSKAFKEKYSQYEDNGTTAGYTPLN